MKRPSVAAAAAWVLLVCAPAHAVAPEVAWHTLETPNFRVHFHEGPHMAALAQKTARLCEAAHALLVPKLGWAPSRRTDVILSDDVDSANGSAYTLYRPWMRLYAEVPDDLSVLNDFDDHLWNLVVHEYTHVLHLDTVTGLPKALNAIFGQLLIPNALVPRWLTEGLATYQESNLSNSGRLRSSLFEMWLRTSVLERPFRLDEVSHVPQAWPRGSLAYLYGGHFLAFVARKVGEERLAEFFRLYGSRLIPWTLNESAQTSWDVDFVRLYDQWLEEARGGYLQQLAAVKAAGLTPFRQLTFAGYGTGQMRFTPDGKRLVYLEAGPDRRPQLRSMGLDGTDDRRIRELWTAGAFDLSPDGARAVISLGDVVDEYYVYEDLHEVELATGRQERLSTGLRAADPTYSPDGRTIAFVGRDGGGWTYLGLWERGAKEARRLLVAPPDQRLFTPVFTPDGAAIVVSQKAGTGRRLVRVDRESGASTVLATSEALLLQPRFTAGGLLLFSSDRSGIYNLYALDPATGRTRQLTNVTTGAFHPNLSPDGATLAFVTYSNDGYDLAAMRLDDAFTGALPDRARRPEPVYRDAPAPPLPARPYQPLRSLLPLYWLPLYADDPLGPSVGLTTGGADILERHQYSLDATFGLVSKEPGFYASYSNRTFHPGFDAWAQSGIAQAAGFRRGLYDRQSAAGAQVSLPSASFEQYSALSLAYEYRWFEPRFRQSFAPDAPRPIQPRRGATGTAQLSFYYSNARGYGDSVSAEEGHAVRLSLRHSSRYTLGDFTFTSLEGRYQTYLAAPWGAHHAFALQVLGGAALGEIGDRPVFALGGIGLGEPIVQLLRGERVGAGALRGYGQGALAGNSYALGTLEYRFPLAVVDRGVWTLPIFLRRLHAAAFADVGAVGYRAFTLAAPRPGVGLEARADLVLGYGLSSMLRLGAAQGLGEDGITELYLTLGSTF